MEVGVVVGVVVGVEVGVEVGEVVGVELYPDETTYSWVKRTTEAMFEPWRCRPHSLPEGRDWREIPL